MNVPANALKPENTLVPVNALLPVKVGTIDGSGNRLGRLVVQGLCVTGLGPAKQFKDRNRVRVRVRVVLFIRVCGWKPPPLGGLFGLWCRFWFKSPCL